MARYWSKSANLTYPHLYSALPLGVTPLEFRRNLWCQKTRFPALSYGVVYVILCLAVLVQYRRVTDRRTNRHTTTAYTVLAQRRAVNTTTIKL